MISVSVELAAGERLLWAVHAEARGGGDSDWSTWQGLRPDPDVPSHLESGVHCCRVREAQMAVMISSQGIWAGKEVLEVGMVGARIVLGASPPTTPPPSMDSCPWSRYHLLRFSLPAEMVVITNESFLNLPPPRFFNCVLSCPPPVSCLEN